MTVSDSVWTVDLNTGLFSSAKIAIPRCVAPRVLHMAATDWARDKSARSKPSHLVISPVASQAVPGVPIVESMLNYGDPTVFVMTRPSGSWVSIADCSPITSMRGDEVLAIPRPIPTRPHWLGIASGEGYLISCRQPRGTMCIRPDTVVAGRFREFDRPASRARSPRSTDVRSLRCAITVEVRLHSLDTPPAPLLTMTAQPTAPRRGCTRRGGARLGGSDPSGS